MEVITNSTNQNFIIKIVTISIISTDKADISMVNKTIKWALCIINNNNSNLWMTVAMLFLVKKTSNNAIQTINIANMEALVLTEETEYQH